MENPIKMYDLGVPLWTTCWCHLDSTIGPTDITNWHDSSFHEQQLSRTDVSIDGPPKWRHLCFQSLSMKFWGDRVLVRWNQMFVCSWSVLERFNFFFGGWWSGMVNHMGSLLSNFSGSPGFFSKVSPSDPPPQNNSWASKFSSDVLYRKISLTCSRRDWKVWHWHWLDKRLYLLKGWWMIPPIHVFVAGVWFGP